MAETTRQDKAKHQQEEVMTQVLSGKQTKSKQIQQTKSEAEALSETVLYAKEMSERKTQ